ncbi:MAG TPA: replicative DNA helicase [Steroidobacteraceae bacterium]|nr:replicative DNA helicase [Steroidobacteraceae bacterium]
MAGGPAKPRRDRESIVVLGGVDAPVPPHSIEAEQAVIGGLLLDTSAWDNVADIVKEEDFYRPDHRLIFAAIAILAGNGKPCDVVTISQHLERSGQLEEAGGLAYLGSVVRDTPTAANVRAYAEIVRERSLLRQLITAGSEIASAVFNSDGRTARELVDEAEARVFEIAESGSRGRQGATAVRTLLPGVIDQIDEAYSNPDSLRGIPTGFTDFDKMTGGLRPGDLVIVAGRPSMGKTTLAVNMAEYAALRPGEKRSSVAIFSMEMPSEQVITRMLSSIGGVPLHNLRSGKISDDDWVRITSATSQLSEAKIFVDETPALSPTELRARARRVKREHGLDLIVVDYLQLMQVPGNKENRATEIAEISRGLKVLAKELACPVIALSQLNRGVEQRENKKPVMSDLRECVTGDALVCLADGRRVQIRDLVGQTPDVLAMDSQERIVIAKTDLVWSVGARPIFEISLASGRKIRATAKHRLYCNLGWQRVGDLRPGDRLAVARKLPEPLIPQTWSEDRVALLAHLIGDGSYLKQQPMRYTTASKACSDVVRTAAEKEFGMKVTRYAGRGNWHQLLLSGNGNRWNPAGVNLWLRELGVFGQRSVQKRVPEAVFALSNRQIQLFLRHLWATDGTISVRKPGQRGGHGVHFSTCSRGLADDVVALLLRLGIVARIQTVAVRYRNPVHMVWVHGVEQQMRFLDTVGAFGPRVRQAELLAEALRGVESNPNVDTLPEEVLYRVEFLMQQNGISRAEMARMRGRANVSLKHCPSRGLAAEYAKLFDDAPLGRAATNDLFWDRIVAIEAKGEEEVFDLTVPATSCWLLDGVISHNSGSIEQDADMILLIYRPEVYDRENLALKGIAEIELVKHRNGEIGTFTLTFQGQFTRFANYVPDSYADGVMR